MKTYSERWINSETKIEEDIKVNEYSFEDWEQVESQVNGLAENI